MSLAHASTHPAFAPHRPAFAVRAQGLGQTTSLPKERVAEMQREAARCSASQHCSGVTSSTPMPPRTSSGMACMSGIDEECEDDRVRMSDQVRAAPQRHEAAALPPSVAGWASAVVPSNLAVARYT